ncbi:type II toxin-antitoxin system VapC family toxin [Sphingomonas sp. Leaf357]|uniref:type II toxin-antitoxin system VapC family toxin n=1 Tax=Sphingomonas sp. Leaf357 TaxID=1736350 RepID=UPI00191C0183|nr:type II toxin-antitoxin system VapC family toxin [Sphingomonas sp. Leaf357]
MLDTHVLLWWLEDNPKLGRGGRSLIDDAQNTLIFSVASAWEIAIKVGQGKLTVDIELALRKFAQAGVGQLDVGPKHLVTVSNLKRLHGDPFDRMIVAQAMCEAITVMTEDAIIKRYPVQTIGCG